MIGLNKEAKKILDIMSTLSFEEQLETLASIMFFISMAYSLAKSCDKEQKSKKRTTEKRKKTPVKEEKDGN